MQDFRSSGEGLEGKVLLVRCPKAELRHGWGESEQWQDAKIHMETSVFFHYRHVNSEQAGLVKVSLHMAGARMGWTLRPFQHKPFQDSVCFKDLICTIVFQ